MDQHMRSSYLMSKKPCHSSWEERAFAEDAGGFCMWPPRSYTCGFCRREFRSAQALGGHMNVHRRDRAMLSHSLANPNANIASRLLGMQDYSKVGVGVKRPRVEVSSSSSSLSLSSSLLPCLKVGERKSSMEELDLELRLGTHDPPQVK